MDELHDGMNGSGQDERKGDLLAKPRAAAAGVANAAAGAAQAVAGAAQAAGDAAGRIFDGFGKDADAGEATSTVRDENGAYFVPDPILDIREEREVAELTERYEQLCEPGMIARAADRAVDVLPDVVKDLVKDTTDKLTQQELYARTMEVLAKGFDAVEKAAASVTVDGRAVVRQVNRVKGGGRIERLDEICLLRAYDVAALAHRDNLQHTLSAFIEGGATGAPGFAGIPFNIVLSTFVYYRAVQSIAMHYGYDVKSDPDEMVLAGQVLVSAFNPSDAGTGGAAEVIGKFMMMAELATVRQVARRGWAAMVDHGGVCLLIAQLRALAHASAKKALENAGQRGLENSVFRSLFEQLGKRLAQKSIDRAIPVVGGVIGALFDTGQMQKILEFADLFYHKRFLVEKAVRIEELVDGVHEVIVIEDDGKVSYSVE